MSRAPYNVFVLPYYFNEKNIEYCIFKRSDLKIWQFVSGGGKDNESPQKAAVRESFEETGILQNNKYNKLVSMCYVPVENFSEAARETPFSFSGSHHLPLIRATPYTNVDFGHCPSLNETEIKYTLERKNVKNINLRIKPDGSVFVSASGFVPQSVIDGFVLRNAQRIIRARKKFAKMPPHGVSLISGSEVSVLGRKYPLKTVESAENAYSFSNGEITLFVRGSDAYENRLSVFDALLFDTAKRIFPALFKACYLQFTAVCKELPELRIRKMTSQWGNCRDKRNIITLNSRLAAFKQDVIRSVIYHEYCHFVHPNHSKEFYALLTQVCPEWKKSKEKLNMIK